MVANINIVVIYRGILTLENVGTMLNYRSIFITLATGANLFLGANLFTLFVS
jgi:hypothetical protein